MSDTAGRILRLADDVASIKTTLGRLEPMIIRIDERMNSLATKAELEALRGQLSVELQTVRTDLARKPSLGAMWAMGITLFALVVAAFSAGAVYLPYVARWLAHG